MGLRGELSEEQDGEQENKHESLKFGPPHNNKVMFDKNINVKDDVTPE